MLILKKIVNGRMNVPEPEYLPTTGGVTYTEGQALYLTGGKLAAASTTNKPTHVSMKNYVAPSTGNLDLPVMRIEPNMVFLADGLTSGTVGATATVDGIESTFTVVEVAGTEVYVSKR